jgi:hypothetical protein
MKDMREITYKQRIKTYKDWSKNFACIILIHVHRKELKHISIEDSQKKIVTYFAYDTSLQSYVF